VIFIGRQACMHACMHASTEVLRQEETDSD
jgi:hypothetical protein